ncbi:carbohydrate ABC transporter permease [Paenibacillus sp. J2TS4]|uniref:carbohydrate ABC transporter permease n=1 Tax=Paenibacillus sp. J2TS4 TaxID=2807194 RepID=UPI001B288439|nr:carbohydrate ABC transporter permease [Paenibacillus sp. J2TS4]GIP33597.1 sugar ABC transporter permease [Paenibacillus sp. J2TS4]
MKRVFSFKPIIIYALVILIVLYVLAPYGWLIISSLSTKADLLTVPLRWIPEQLTLDHYRSILFGGSASTSDAGGQFVSAMKNSMIIAASVTVLALFFGVLAAYALSRLKFKGRKPATLTILLVQMVPPIALIIPMYIILSKASLMNNKWALIVVYLSFVLPFVIWIMRGYLAGISPDLEEAARIDGCSKLRAFFTIVLPVSLSGLAATTIFAFIMSWNEFFYALNFTTTLEAKTLPVVITEFSSKHGADYIMTSTGGVIASLPPVLLALFFQRYIISGLSSGAVKG